MRSSCLNKVLIEFGFNQKSFIGELSFDFANVVDKPELDIKLTTGQLRLDRQTLRLVGLLVPEHVHVDVLVVVLGLNYFELTVQVVLLSCPSIHHAKRARLLYLIF